jgi:redox-sensitive bicupin YhaK (pirin superfamily)
MCLFVFNISGNITVNGQQVSERDAIGVWDTDQISINCNEESEFLIIETVINQK